MEPNTSGPVLVVQRTLPHYRREVFEELGNRFPGRLLLAASEDMPGDLTPLGMESSLPFVGIKVQRIAVRHRDILYRIHGIKPLLQRIRPMALVIEANPRIVTTWSIPGMCAGLGVASLAWTKFAGVENSPLRRKIWRAYVPRWDAFISYGESSKSSLPDYGVAPERIFVAQNAVRVPESDSELAAIEAQARELRNTLGLANKFVVVSLGRLVRQKRFEDVIRAFIELRREGVDAVLCIVGSGPEDAKLRRLAHESCREARIEVESIRFIGVVPDGDDAVWLKLADVAVFGGAAGLGINVSLVVGTATLICDEEGCDTELLVNGVTGMRFPPGDVLGLRSNLMELIDDARKRATLGSEGRKIVLARATIQHMVDGMETAIRWAVERRKRGPEAQRLQ